MTDSDTNFEEGLSKLQPTFVLQDRDLHEKLLCNRFSFLLVFVSIVAVGAFSVDDESIRFSLLCFATVVSAMLTLAIQRSQAHIDYMIKNIFEKEPDYPDFWIRPALEKEGSKSRRHLIGQWIPRACVLFLFIASVFTGRGLLVSVVDARIASLNRTEHNNEPGPRFFGISQTVYASKDPYSAAAEPAQASLNETGDKVEAVPYSFGVHQQVFLVFFAIFWGTVANVQPRWKAFDWPLAFRYRHAANRVTLAFFVLNVMPIVYFAIILWLTSGFTPAESPRDTVLRVVFHGVIPSFGVLGMYKIWLAAVEWKPSWFYKASSMELDENHRHAEPVYRTSVNNTEALVVDIPEGLWFSNVVAGVLYIGVAFISALSAKYRHWFWSVLVPLVPVAAILAAHAWSWRRTKARSQKP